MTAQSMKEETEQAKKSHSLRRPQSAAGDDEIALARRTRGFMALEEADRLTYKFPSYLSFALVSTHSVVVRSAYTGMT